MTLKELLAKAPALPWSEQHMTGPSRGSVSPDKRQAVSINGIGVHSEAQYAAFDLALHAVNLLPELVEALRKLHCDCTASDFNEHWDSYTQAEALLKKANTINLQQKGN